MNWSSDTRTVLTIVSLSHFQHRADKVAQMKTTSVQNTATLQQILSISAIVQVSSLPFCVGQSVTCVHESHVVFLELIKTLL